MSIWTLLIFALGMLAAVVASYAHSDLLRIAQWVFALSLAVVVVAIVVKGTRRPVA